MRLSISMSASRVDPNAIDPNAVALIEAIAVVGSSAKVQLGAVTRAEAARLLGLSRARLADLERNGTVTVGRDARGVPRYTEEEVARISALLDKSRDARQSTRFLREPPDQPEHAVTLRDVARLDEQPTGEANQRRALEEVDSDEARRLRIEAAVARADLERVQAVALRDEAVRLLREAERIRCIERLVSETRDTVLTFERDVVERVLRQRLLGASSLDEGFELRALIAGALTDARAELTQQRMEADRVAAAHRTARARAVAEEQSRAATARAIDDDRRLAEDHARRHAYVEAQQRAFVIASTIASEVASQGCPWWIAESAGAAAWSALAQVDPVALYNDSVAYTVARNAGHHAAAVAVSESSYSSNVDDLGVRRHRHRRRGR